MQAASRRVKQTTITFEIEDTGVGIAPDELDSIFKAFVQVKADRKFQEGTGLGLTIARSFVQLISLILLSAQLNPLILLANNQPAEHSPQNPGSRVPMS